MAWAGRHPLVDAVLPPGGPVTSSEPVLGGAEGVSPTAKLVWDLARAYLSQNPALSSAPMAGAAIGVPGGAARTVPRPQSIDLRKLANDYARFVMGKAEAPIKEPDPRTLGQLQSAYRLQSSPGAFPTLFGTGGARPNDLVWARPSEEYYLSPYLRGYYPNRPDLPPGPWALIKMPGTNSGIPLMQFKD